MAKLFPERNLSLDAEHPELVRAVYQGFLDAKYRVAEQCTKGMIFNNMATMMPWLSKLVEADRDSLGDDWWPSGMRANRKAFDTFLRYHYDRVSRNSGSRAKASLLWSCWIPSAGLPHSRLFPSMWSIR